MKKSLVNIRISDKWLKGKNMKASTGILNEAPLLTNSG